MEREIVQMLELTDLKHEMQLMRLSGNIMQTVIKTVEFTDWTTH